MGLESANYAFAPARVEAEQFVRAIQSLGGVEDSEAMAGTREFLIRDQRYWIDLQWLIQSQNAKQVSVLTVDI